MDVNQVLEATLSPGQYQAPSLVVRAWHTEICVDAPTRQNAELQLSQAAKADFVSAGTRA